MQQSLSVSTLNNQIKSLLETSFSRVLVEGELSRVTYHNSGHIYFSLKDATSSIRGVMFRGNASRLRFELEEGLKVVVDAAITLYTPRGEYQLNCFSIEPSGQGALAFAYEQLKQKLQAKGYFDTTRKKPLPKFPSKIAIITSATSAALQDMLRVAQNRYRVVSIDIYDVLVQGQNASYEIASAIQKADGVGYDAIVVGRGGGSMEDLWAFNEENVADAIFHAQTPIISAVGHEIDYALSDFVADVRAATPSNAMELLLPDTQELYIYIDSLMQQYGRVFSQKLQRNTQELVHLKELFLQNSVEKRLQNKKEEILSLEKNLYERVSRKLEKFEGEVAQLRVQFPYKIENILQHKQNQQKQLQNMLESNNPKKRVQRGFAQVLKDEKIVDLQALQKGDDFELQSSDVAVVARVIEKRNIQ